MSNGWFGGARRPRGEVDWARHVHEDRKNADRALWALIGINVVVFVAWAQVSYLPGSSLLGMVLRDHFLVGLPVVDDLRLWTLVTSAFSHIRPWHLIFNMIGLYVFGRAVGQAKGTRVLLQLYLVGGIVASLGHVLYAMASGDPTPALGASGAVMALAVMYGLMFPNRVLLVNFFIPVPAGVAVGLFIVMDLVGLISLGSPIAHAAHLGGAAYGFAYWYLYERRG
ncbi:MAG: rhomboid family intramembrane serine protease [Myxococcales bacterium]|nr:rhomboid family intramembrane serine protease [Myxococcales bacterium]